MGYRYSPVSLSWTIKRTLNHVRSADGIGVHSGKYRTVRVFSRRMWVISAGTIWQHTIQAAVRADHPQQAPNQHGFVRWSPLGCDGTNMRGLYVPLFFLIRLWNPNRV